MASMTKRKPPKRINLRGDIPGHFFLACLAALELDGVALDEI
jgi:hypothetical protein